MGLIEDMKVLEKYGVKTMKYRVATSEEEAVKAAKAVGYPVAMKVVSNEILHKSDVGGVKVGLENAKEVRLAYQTIMSNVKKRAPKAKVDGIMVQPMARKGVELLIGGKKDPSFGHMILLGLGGIYVEIFKDVSARLCPIRAEDVEEMVHELKSAPILLGARGKKPISMKALSSLMVSICRLMESEDLKELDLNPVVFDNRGYDIVDVRLIK